jgi:L-alanine-DL-glutamate epimerase-like enolase superfamily enzyme
MEHDLGRYLGDKFKGRFIGDYLQKAYRGTIPVFHLVGGLDKLRKSELDATDVRDGLPNSLDEWVERDGLTCLKVKLKGTDMDWDLNRILDVVDIAHEVKERTGNSPLYFSADTNEQCKHPDYIVELLLKLKERSERAFSELLYVEQPTERDLYAHEFDMSKAAGLKPVILDESPIDLQSFYTALELGWSGIALKTCKCHTHALMFACLAEENKIPYTVQDLTNPGIALIHSVGLAARLNPMMGVESNSMQFFPNASTAEAAVHKGLYERKCGSVSTKSLIGHGFGYQMERIKY